MTTTRLPVGQFVPTNYTLQDASTYKASIDAGSDCLSRIGAQFAVQEMAAPSMKVCVMPGHLLNGITLTEVGIWLNATILTATTTFTVPTAAAGAITNGMTIYDPYTGNIASGTTVTISGTTVTMSAYTGAAFNGLIFIGQVTGTISAPVTSPRIDRVVCDQTTGVISVVTGVESSTPSAPAIPSGKYPLAQILLQTTTTSITNSIITDERDFTPAPQTASTIPVVAAGGSADAITATYSPAITLANLTMVAFTATAANTTTTPTFAPNGLTAHTITKRGGSPLVAGDIPGAAAVMIVEYNLANTRWELANPAVPTVAVTQTAGTGGTAVSTCGYSDTAAANAAAAANAGLQVDAATTAAGDTSAWTYSNGASGVGATLTGPVNTAITIDGYAFSAINKDLLVKNDTQSPSGAFNGVYRLTAVQTVGTGAIFTRRTDYNSSSNINDTGAIAITSGTVNGGASYILTTKVTTVGTDPLTYTIFTPPYANIVQVGGALGTPSSGGLANCTGLPVAGGGTGLATMTTAYAVICAGTTATGALQPLAALGASGTVLTSNGAGALPSFQATASTGSGGSRALAGTDTVIATDNGKLLTVSGTCALALSAAATAGSMTTFIKNTATTGIQIITITPNGAENLDGANSTLVMLPGEMRSVSCNATAWTTAVIEPFKLNITTTATPVLPRNGYQGVSGQIWGGGASGGAGATQGGGGGGGGGYNQFTLMTGSIAVASLSLTCTIGAGGLSQTSANTAGNPGGTTTVVTGGSFQLGQAYGGGAGGGGSLGAGGGGGTAGAFATTGNVFSNLGVPVNSGVGANAVTTTFGNGGSGFINGNSGGAGLAGQGDAAGCGGNSTTKPGGGGSLYGGGGGGVSSTGTTGIGGSALYAGGGGGGASGTTGSAGGGSVYGGAGGAGGSNGAGTGGSVGGGGGGGAVGTAGSGAGGGGRIILVGIC